MNARWLTLVALVVMVPEARAQQPDTSLLVRPPTTTTLSLAEAVQQAREHNPQFRQTVNSLDPASAQVKAAYGAFIPNVGASAGLNYTGEGSQFFGGQTFTQPSSYGSTYQIGFDWTFSGATALEPSRAKKAQRAAVADTAQGSLQLAEQVVTQYLNALQTQSTAEVARQQLRRNLEFLQLATARQRVGQTSMYDVRQADVTANNSKVDLLRARQAEVDQKLELFRLMGVMPSGSMEALALTDTFPVMEPTWELEALAKEAEDNNPGLQAERARAAAAQAQLKQARSAYLPYLSLNGGWSGYTQEFSNAENKPFPFDFTNNPFGVNLGIALPIFQGFSRSLRVSQARAQQRNAEENVRALELQLRATIGSRLQATRTTYDVIQVQRQSQQAARQQLELANERYRLGSGTVLEVADALNAVTAADAAYINAVSDHQRAIVALYAALGRNYR
jgi:outer membrane protein